MLTKSSATITTILGLFFFVVVFVSANAKPMTQKSRRKYFGSIADASADDVLNMFMTNPGNELL